MVLMNKTFFPKMTFYKRELYVLSNDDNFWSKPNPGIACWYCSHEDWKNVPFSMPTNYSEELQKFEVKGVYCSLNCVKKDIICCGGYDMHQRLEWLTLMAELKYGIIDDIVPTPDTYLFEKFRKDGKGKNFKKWHAGTKTHTLTLRGKPFIFTSLLIESPFQDLQCEVEKTKKRKRDEPEPEKQIKYKKKKKKNISDLFAK